MQDWELEEYLQRIHDAQLSTKRSLDEQRWQQSKSKSTPVFSGKTKAKIILIILGILTAIGAIPWIIGAIGLLVRMF